MRNRVRNDYSRVWRRVCVEWLGWPESRFERFLHAFNAKLKATDDGATWFYHEPPLYHIIGLLVTEEFEERLHREVRKARYGSPEWVYFRRELLDTIDGSPLSRGRLDWTAARERAVEHLALYRQKFPSPKIVTNYEKMGAQLPVNRRRDQARDEQQQEKADLLRQPGLYTMLPVQVNLSEG